MLVRTFESLVNTKDQPRRDEAVLPEIELIRGGVSDYEVVPSAACDVEWASELAKRVYSGVDVIPREVMLDWFEANPYGFPTIKPSGNGPVGNLDILPIRPNTLRRIVAGTLLERDVTGDCLYGASEKERIEDLYIESFAVDPACARSAPGIIIEVLSSFIDLVNRICNPGQVHRVYAIAASDEGSGLLARLGFESVGPSDGRRDGHQLSLWTIEVVAGRIYTLLVRRLVRTKSATSFRLEPRYHTHRFY